MIIWFNPLVYLAFKTYQDDIELACDEMVLRNISEEKKYEYTQSLLDVIKLSKYGEDTPLSISFCKDKSILRKRVMNMIQPQKKSKTAEFTALLLTIIMIIGCFTTACQPMPEELIVQNKADDELQQAIAQTAAPTGENDEQNSSVSSQPEQIEPIYFKDHSANASNTVTVDIQAEVINNQPDNIPVVKIEPKLFTEDEVKQMVQAFFGNTQLYKRDLSKEDYDEWILNKQFELNDDEKLQAYADDRNITNLGEARNQIQEAIERIKNDRKNASDEREKTDFGDLYSEHGFNLFIDTGKGFLGNVIASKDSVLLSAFNDNNRYYLSRILGKYISIDLDSADTQYQKAKQMALDLISNLDNNSVLGDASIVNDSVEGSNRQFYVFYFERAIGESKLDHNLSSGSASAWGDMSGKDCYEEGVYEKRIPYERLEVWVEGDRIVQFKNSNPIKITETLNDNVAIAVDYIQAVELAKQFAYVAFVDMFDNYIESKININRIELVLARTKELDTGGFIVVPAWNFYGTWPRKFKPELRESQGTDENGWDTIQGRTDMSDTLITVNALDGSIIDMEHGY